MPNRLWSLCNSYSQLIITGHAESVSSDLRTDGIWLSLNADTSFPWSDFEQRAMAYTDGSYQNSSGCISITSGNDSMTQWNASSGPCLHDYSQKQHLKSILSNVLSGLISFIMVGIGCSIEGRKILKHIKKPTGVVSGLFCQFGKYNCLRGDPSKTPCSEVSFD